MIQLDFFRYEHKYLIPNYLAPQIMIFLSNKGRLDPYNKGGKPYEIRSLYFDSPALTFYKEKINGYPDRKKIRVRSYSNRWDARGGLFLEIKAKKWDKIYKERCPIATDDLTALLKGAISPLAKAKENPVWRKVCYFNQQYHLLPQAVVYYQRVSFLDRLVNLKISFDSQIKVWSPQTLAGEKNALSVLDNSSVMEVKFSQTRPRYYFDLIKEFNLQLVSFSKYCHSLDKLKNACQYQ